MADRQEKAENMRLLHDTLLYSLTENERKRFTLILNEYQNGRDRRKFVLSLRELLSTAGKQEVVPYLLAILPSKERDNFLQLWMKTSNYNTFYAADNSSNHVTRSSLNSSQNTTPSRQRNCRTVLPTDNSLSLKPKYVTFSPTPPSQRLQSTPRISPKQKKTRLISLKRSAKDNDFGFSIRGGQEHGLGIFVSAVDEGSNAEKVNLSCGDQIIKLNQHNFQDIQHSKAVQVCLLQRILRS